MAAIQATVFDDIKRMPMNIDLVSGFPSKLIYKAIAAWPACFIGWWKPEISPLSLDLSDEARSRRLWVWDGARFDTKKLFLEIGPSYGDVIAKLAAACIIYPDGTYNQEFFHQYRMVKEAGSVRRH